MKIRNLFVAAVALAVIGFVANAGLGEKLQRLLGFSQVRQHNRFAKQGFAVQRHIIDK